MEAKDIAAYVGAITGPLALLVSFLNYRRDRPRVRVTLDWDVAGRGEHVGDTMLAVTVSNTGRRTIFLTRALIEIPGTGSAIVLDDSAKTLAEGSPAARVEMVQSRPQLYEHRNSWWLLRATVIDASQRRHRSDWPTNQPSWASGVPAPWGRISMNKLLNAWRRIGL